MIHAYSENGWDPLKIVMLGDFIPPDLLKETLNFSKFDAIKPWLMKIAWEFSFILKKVNLMAFN